MREIIVDAVTSLVTQLQNNAQALGVEPENILRTYTPAYFCEELTPGAVYIAVYLQDCDLDAEEVIVGITKKMPVRVAVLAKLTAQDLTQIDPTVTTFEKVQNFFARFQSWTSALGAYRVTSAETVAIADAEGLEDMLLSMSFLDIKIETMVPYETDNTITPSCPVVLLDSGAPFPTVGVTGTLYVDMTTTEKRVYSGSEWVVVDRPLRQDIAADATHSQIPTARAVYEYVQARTDNLNWKTNP